MPISLDIIGEYDCESGAILLSDMTNYSQSLSTIFPIYQSYAAIKVFVNNIQTGFYVGAAALYDIPFSSVFSVPNQYNVLLGSIPNVSSGVIHVEIYDTFSKRIGTDIYININCNSIECIRKKMCLSDCCNPCKKCSKELQFLILGYIAYEGAAWCETHNKKDEIMKMVGDFCKLNKKCC